MAPLLRPGDTCWRLERAGRLKFLIDDAAYYAALRDAFSAARRSIHVLSWGFDPRTRLAPDGARGGGAPDEIGHTLIELTNERPELEARLLIWRSALPISATQDFFPHRAKAWFRGSRVQFQLDAEVPFGACHHQKVVVIDDALAFIGSGDITGDRWDTPEHLDDDIRRRTPDGGLHPPRHEMMAMVDGPAASALGDLFRERWRTATGETLAHTAAVEGDLWPRGATPDLTGAPVAIARTLPAWRGRTGVGEIARLTQEAIAGAKQLIYLENQYFTSPTVAEALAERLMAPDGPEVLLISSHKSPSYFDQMTMDRTRSVALWRLKAADIFGRLHAFAPYTAGGRPIIVHSKVMIVDDRLARISSANLNNRSEGFDSECELAVEARGEADQVVIAGLRNRLAGHWVGVGAEAVTEASRSGPGFAESLRRLGAHGRLRDIEPERLGGLGEFVAAFHIGDPVDAADAWRPARRRERLYGRVRALRQAAIAAGEIPEPPPEEDDPTLPAPPH